VCGLYHAAENFVQWGILTLFASPSPRTVDAVRLLSAVGDNFRGRRVGFGMHVARVAARFTAHRGSDPEAIAGAFYAAALHQIGAVRVIVARDSTERAAEITRWDNPPAGAAVVTALGVFPAVTADAIRWHREAVDGTGFPDRLRWNGIPETAMVVNVSRAFVEALEAQADTGGSAADAVFTLVETSGSIFALATMRDFRAFLEASPATFDAPYEPEWELPESDPYRLIAGVCTEIDARQPRTTGRGDRLEDIVRAIVAQLGDRQVDPDRAAFACRLTALARISRDGSRDDIFILSRLGTESRAAQAQTAARILETTLAFAPFAPVVGTTEEWYDGSGLPSQAAGAAIDPLTRIITVALAAEAVVANDADERIRRAAGTRLDPEIVAAYLAAELPR